MGAAVSVLVRCRVVTVQVEGAVVLVLVVVTADVENDTRSVVVRVVAQSWNRVTLAWKSHYFLSKVDTGKGACAPLVPRTPSTPNRCAVKVTFGDGSRGQRS